MHLMHLDAMALVASGAASQQEFFGKSSINSVAKWDGLVYGEWRLFAAQIEGILITIAIAVVGTLICVGIVRIFTPLRVTDREEKLGLDISQHGESAYPSFNGMDQ